MDKSLGKNKILITNFENAEKIHKSDMLSSKGLCPDSKSDFLSISFLICELFPFAAPLLIPYKNDVSAYGVPSYQKLRFLLKKAIIEIGYIPDSYYSWEDSSHHLI